MSVDIVASHRVFGGSLSYVEHEATATRCRMRFSIFVPDGADKAPVVTWLSGLTCTEENFTAKAGAYRVAAELGLIIVAPDTSPRGEGVANDDAYDLGQGAGFYLTATEAPWSDHFRMDQYVTEDLQRAVLENFPGDPARQALFGHSMGGHGALTLGLKNRDIWSSVSAFAPIVAPMQVPWGQKAFTAYLGDDQSVWAQYDACALLKDGGALPNAILIDQGGADSFLEEQLKPHLFEEVCKEVGQDLILNHRDGYDHSYFFISTFMEEHLRFHAKNLL